MLLKYPTYSFRKLCKITLRRMLNLQNSKKGMSQHHVISFVMIFYVYLTHLLTLTLIPVFNWAQIILPFVEKVVEGLAGLGEIILIPVQLCSESEFQKIIIVIFSNNEDSNMFQSKRTNPLSF